jgi:N-methylhydantoinase A
MSELVSEGVAELLTQGYAEGISVQRTLEMRYSGQNYELELPIAFDAFTPENTALLWSQFHAAHAARFGFDIPGEIIEIVNFSATAISATPKPDFLQIAAATGPAAALSERSVMYPAGRQTTKVYARSLLRAGHLIAGPAIVEEAASVTIVNPGQELRVDAYGHLLLARTP